MIEWALIVALFFVMAGNAPPAVNEAHYWTKARHFWDPHWCARDPFLASRNAHFVYFAAFGGLTECMSLTAAAWTGRFVGWSLLAASWLWLSRAIVRRPGYALFSAGVASVLWQWATMAGEWVVGGLEAKVVSYALVFAALGCQLRGALAPAAWWLAGAVAFHPIVGLWSTLLAILASCSEINRSSIARARLSLILSAIVIAAVISLTWWSDRAVAAERTVANSIYVYHRLAHHLVLHRMEVIRVLRFAVLVGGWILLQQGMRWESGCNATVSRENRFLRRFAMGSLLLVAVGALFDLASFFAPDLSAAILRFYWFRLADVAIPLSVAMLLAELLERHRTKYPNLFASMLSVCLVLTTVGVAARFFQLRADRRPGADRQGQVLGALDRQQAEDRLWDWRQMCAWANEQTSPDSLFLTPLYSQTFRWYAQRAELVNWKDIPQDAAAIFQWISTIDRIRDSGLYKSASIRNTKILQSLLDDFGVDYIVTVKELGSLPMPLPIVYQNVSYCVYCCTGKLK